MRKRHTQKPATVEEEVDVDEAKSNEVWHGFQTFGVVVGALFVFLMLLVCAVLFGVYAAVKWNSPRVFFLYTAFMFVYGYAGIIPAKYMDDSEHAIVADIISLLSPFIYETHQPMPKHFDFTSYEIKKEEKMAIRIQDLPSRAVHEIGDCYRKISKIQHSEEYKQLRERLIAIKNSGITEDNMKQKADEIVRVLTSEKFEERYVHQYFQIFVLQGQKLPKIIEIVEPSTKRAIPAIEKFIEKYRTKIFQP
jgi:hypothetical protein